MYRKDAQHSPCPRIGEERLVGTSYLASKNKSETAGHQVKIRKIRIPIVLARPNWNTFAMRSAVYVIFFLVSLHGVQGCGI